MHIIFLLASNQKINKHKNKSLSTSSHKNIYFENSKQLFTNFSPCFSYMNIVKNYRRNPVLKILNEPLFYTSALISTPNFFLVFTN